MTLTVLNVAYAPCAVRSVGGAEQVLAAIDRALVAAGLHSIVVACEGSRVHGTLHATPLPAGVIDEGTHAAARAAHARAIDEVLAMHDVDVVHFHGVDFHTYLPREGVPALATLHLPPSWYPRSALAPTRARTFVHCVSQSQLRACPPSAAMLPPIPNGVEIPPVPHLHGERRGVVALGRICPEKGFHIALSAARRAGAPLTLAGRVFPYAAHIDYWDREIAPRLDDQRRFIGVVGPERRTELLARARCVLIPSLVDETSSLVAMEALAVGTPVVAFGKGALPEIIDHGVTGFLVHDEREMADAIGAAATLDPDACRAAAIERFSVETMTARYLDRYAMLARARSAVEDALPTVGSGRPRALALVTPHARSPLDLTVSDTAPAMAALVPEWRQLAGVAGCTPFQSPEWLLPWWRHFGAGAPALLEMRSHGELVGVAPLYVRQEANGERVLALIGTGNTDYVDVIAHPPHRHAVAATLAAYLADTRTEWDRCELGPLAAESTLLELRAPVGWHASVEQMDVCPVLTLAEASGVAGSIPARFLSQLRYAARRLAREHDVRFDAAGAASAPELLDALFTLHGARWESRGSDGVLADARTRAFHHEVVAGMAARGMLRLHVMRVDGRVAAAFYGFGDGKRLYYYLGGFDPAFARHSAGSLVILHAVEAAVACGGVEVDFLRGAEPYKYRWGASDRGVHALRLRAAESGAEEAA